MALWALYCPLHRLMNRNRTPNKPMHRTATKRCSFDGHRRHTTVVAVVSALPVVSVILIVGLMNALRRAWFLTRATRAAKRSRLASITSVRLSHTSVGLCGAATESFHAARHARESGSFPGFVWFYLRGKWLLFCSRWLIGRSQRLGAHARAKLKTSERYSGFTWSETHGRTKRCRQQPPRFAVDHL